MKSAHTWAGVLLTGCLLLLAPARADVLLNDTFSDGARNDANLPGSAAWVFARTTADGYISTEGTFVGTNNSAGTGFVAPFAASALTLAVGESIQLSFDYQYGSNNLGDNVFRVNLYNSGGVRTTNDNTGLNNAVFNGWTGYGFSGQFGTNGALRYRVSERAPGANNLFSGYSSFNTTVQSNGSQVSTWYNAQLTLSRISAGSMLITANLGGQTLSATDTVSALTSFGPSCPRNRSSTSARRFAWKARPCASTTSI